MTYSQNDLLFVPLGGSGEIGMNVNLYHYQDSWIMVDLGISFPDDSTPGVDVILPDLKFIAERRDKLAGLVLTHGHEDHLGAIPYLWSQIGHGLMLFKREFWMGMKMTSQCHPLRMKCFRQVVKSIP